MKQCYKTGDFKLYFIENMQALHLPIPSTYFDSYNMAIANAMVMIETLKSLGSGATVAELIGATIGLEKLKIAAAFGAAAYVGATIGSIAVASGRSLGCGSRIVDMFSFLEQEKLTFPGWRQFYFHTPEIFNKNHPQRKMLAIKMRSFPTHFEYS
ncbi:MAG: hypothetical protein ACC707_03005 [Thiohalomonadales bacterium]